MVASLHSMRPGGPHKFLKKNQTLPPSVGLKRATGLARQSIQRFRLMKLASIPLPELLAAVPRAASATVTITNIAVVDDHAIIRAIFKSITEDTPDLQLTWTAPDLSMARSMLQRDSRPDLLIVDVTLPDGDGFELIEEVLLNWPDMRVLMISSHDDKEYAQRARSLGAIGYVTKTASPKDLVRILQRVCDGEEIFEML